MKRLLRSRTFRISASLALSLVFLYLAFHDIPLAAVGLAIRQAQIVGLILALVMVAVNHIFKIVRWRVLLGPPGRQVRFYDLTLAFLSGQMLNILLPVRIGDLSRAYTVGSLGPGRAFVLGTVLLEKILDLVWYLLVLGLLFALVKLPGWLSSSAVWLALAAVGMVIAAYLVAYRRQQFLAAIGYLMRWLPPRWQDYVISRMRAGLESLNVIQKPADLLFISIWSAGIWFSAAMTNFFCLQAMGIPLGFTASLLILAALQAGITLTNIPGRIGIFEYINVLVLALFGVGQVDALAYGLVLHGIALGIPALLGIIAFWILGVRGQRPTLSDAFSQS